MATPPSTPTVLCTTSAALLGAVTVKNRMNNPIPHGQISFFMQDLAAQPAD
ncbi:hypothetical protein [Candidatus Frankia alpina]|uniref:hypothetical protein n=1 Tax=Candidatus Frankia alpina TaxID=2699483 RepID=UPI0013D5B248|nr:hypothetical protein [Candidatus Frankia alpina]